MQNVVEKSLRRAGLRLTPSAELLGWWGLFAAVLAVGLIAADASAVVGLSAFVAVLPLTVPAIVRAYPHDRLGLCNAVTLARAAMVAFLCGALMVPSTVSPWVVLCVAVVAFSLDGVDGWLARRSGLSSDFGARFDMETDAALAAVLTLWLLLTGVAGPEILVLGFARYVFVAAGWIWPALQAELPPSLRRKTVCVIQIAALIALVFPLTPPALHLPVSMVASVAVLVSFAIDTRWLLRAAL